MRDSALRRPFALPARPRSVVALTLLALMVVLALIGPWVVPHDPVATRPIVAMQPPSPANLFGTDQLGRDVFSRVVVATRIDLTTAFAAVVLSLVVGSAIGSLAGWAGGWIDRMAGRLLDLIMAFPLFVLAVGIAAALGNSVTNVVLATAIVNLPFYARYARAEVNRRRNAGFVQAARMSGHGPLGIVGIHILPNIAPGLLVQSSLNMGWAILNAAGLSFIGLGVRPPQPEWGIMVSEGAGYIISGEWWLFVFPGSALMLAVLAFSLTGDMLRDRFSPRGR